MLASLLIDNYALIDHLEFNPNDGFVVITGETGAGKSIIMGALNLILGGRADVKSLKDESKKCVIEGTFDINGLGLYSFFDLHELDYEETCVIRREITPSGKSRSFINDTPVNLTQLKEIAELLIDVHSQHQNLLIKDKNFHLNLLDIWCNHLDLIDKYQKSFSLQKKLKKEWKDKLEELQKKKQDQDYISFQYSELEASKLVSEEQEKHEQMLQEMEHSEEIKYTLSSSLQALLGDDLGILAQVKTIKASLHKIASYHSKYAQFEERIQSSFLELQDISSEIERSNEVLIYEPQELEEIKQRLDLIFSLQQKHKVQTVDELLQIQESLQSQLLELEDSNSIIENLQHKYEKALADTQKLALQISKNRKLIAPEIEQLIIELLQQLGMPHVQLKIDFQTIGELTFYGVDDVSMLFAANKGSKPHKVEDTASGGEIARLLLSIKAIMARKKNLSSIIFDEIDTGVSGEIAHKMAKIMKEMSSSMQVICITHLPQIGAKGSSHFKVYKEIESTGTKTNIRLLSKEERIKEVAYMLSGEQLTPASLDNAKDLLK